MSVVLNRVYRPHISQCDKAADVFHVPLNAAFWHPNFQNHVVTTFVREDENFQHSCWRGITGIHYRSHTSWLDTSRLPLNVTRNLFIHHLYNDDCVNTTVFPAHCALHTADRFQAFVLFNIAFSSYNEPPPVSTHHYFCCFVIWTYRLYRDIMLCVKEWNKAVMTIEFV